MTARAAVVIVPRERLSATPTTLADVLAATPPDVPVVCLDSGHTRADRRRLAALADDRTTVVRLPRWRTPNEARNAGVRHVDAEHVVFIDNDVLVRDGWLDALVDCADATGAWVVSPLTMQGPWDAATVHVAGGTLTTVEQDGVAYLLDRLGNGQRRAEEVVGTLDRTATDLAEFHCVLVRRAALDALGPLDEGLLCMQEHIDLCLGVAAAGGEVWFEPSSVVTYVGPPPLKLADLPYYLLRWSETWNDRTLEHFEQKRGVRPPPTQTTWVRRHRFRAFLPLLRPLARLVGQDRVNHVRDVVLTPAETVLNRLVGPGLERLRP